MGVVQPVAGSAAAKLDYLINWVLTQLKHRVTAHTSPTVSAAVNLHRNTPGSSQNILFLQHPPPSLDGHCIYVPKLITDDATLSIVDGYFSSHDVYLLGFSDPHITAVLKFVLTKTYDRAGNRYYKQVKGTSYHTSDPCAEVLVDQLFLTALATRHNCHIHKRKPLGLENTRWTPPLLTALNDVSPGMVAFTEEQKDSEGWLSFLDVHIQIQGILIT